MLKIYTAQYRYSGPDRVDVTAKGASGIIRSFAPWWGLVNAMKAGRITEEQYREQYEKHLDNVPGIDLLLLENRAWGNEITLVCFCKSGNFCHRVILAEWLAKMGVGEYMGERENNG